VHEEVYRDSGALFENVFAAMKMKIPVRMILQGQESNPEWDEEPLILAAISGAQMDRFSLHPEAK
jgi:hypothetical protein